jgi:hypothetical protein
MIDEIDIVVLFLLVVISVMLGCQHIRKKHKNHNKTKYTCGVEGECEKSIHGTYDSKSQCESECGMLSQDYST